MFCMLKKKSHILFMFQNLIHIVKNELFILMIPNGEKWHYLAVKKLSALLRRITSKRYRDFYCLNCLHFFRAKKKQT